MGGGGRIAPFFCADRWPLRGCCSWASRHGSKNAVPHPSLVVGSPCLTALHFTQLVHFLLLRAYYSTSYTMRWLIGSPRIVAAGSVKASRSTCCKGTALLVRQPLQEDLGGSD